MNTGKNKESIHGRWKLGEDMRIWHDACTGKHVRYGIAIAKRLRKLGHEVILTTRKHPDTVALARALGEKPIVVGTYKPESLNTRLEESARRMLEFSDMFKTKSPDMAISNQSVELSRVAFGLNIHTTMTADTPHAEAVNRLTVPLSDDLVISAAIPEEIFRQYGAKRIIQFQGVDEVAWIRSFKT
jgi:predicted glycosyltransferase